MTMTEQSGPDPHRCVTCHRSESACDNRQTMADLDCCDQCDHETPGQAR